MGDKWKYLYEAIAEVTGKDPFDVEKQLNKTPQRDGLIKSSRFVTISESFPDIFSQAVTEDFT